MNTAPMHTPGPWETGKGACHSVYAEQRDGKRPKIAQCYSIDGNSFEDFANARLIAAAPELLTLAKQYASECGECAGVGITVEDEDCVECAQIRAAIAKAGGAL